MSLQDKIDQDIRKAMLAKDNTRLRALRAIKSAILLAKTEKSNTELSEGLEISLLQKLAKQRRESAEIYERENRLDLLAIEEEELKVIEEYLPAQLSRAEVEEKIKEIFAEHQFMDKRDMGKAMGLARVALEGQTDGKTISEVVKALLPS